jgi:lipoprotein-anchoring transpeptidase ErfK/SrfK
MIRTVSSPICMVPVREGRPALTRSDLPRLGRLGALAFAAALGAVAITLLAAMIVTFIALKQAAPGMATSVADQGTDVPLDGAIRVSPSGWLARFESATLWEAPQEGKPRPTEIPLQVELLRRGWLPGQTQLMIRPAAGPLRPDAAYRLVLRGSALAAALPWPRPAAFEQEVRFTTLASPRPLPAPEATHLDWEAPFAIHWNIPIADYSYEVSPPATTRAWSDPDRRTSYVVIENPQEAATYQIAITDARGANGIALQRPTSYTVVAPARPRPLEADEPLTAEIGKPLAIRWNVPIDHLKWEISPQLLGDWQLDSQDRSLSQLRLDGLAQGTTYRLTVHEAVAENGAPLAEPLKLTVATPPPLTADLLTGGGIRAPVTARPIIAFSEPIRDRSAVEKAITLEPSQPGHFEWIDDRQIRFIPARALPYDTKLIFRLRADPEGIRSVAGGYFEEPQAFSFVTAPNKTIDVSIGRQVLTLIDGSQAVRSFSVATGIPGADTPLGEFRVQYKMPTARFVGYNAAANHAYDLPDVKWVLSFMGDYTIHGAYWRQAFGTPGSNGCVSLTDGDAQVVYNWATEGTLVRIHY